MAPGAETCPGNVPTTTTPRSHHQQHLVARMRSWILLLATAFALGSAALPTTQDVVVGHAGPPSGNNAAQPAGDSHAGHASGASAHDSKVSKTDTPPPAARGGHVLTAEPEEMSDDQSHDFPSVPKGTYWKSRRIIGR
ncbi:hypothetical protein ANO11243_093930 [Dothideomycetidae sp. 11243]|nr:hypothetical protein ANO11243_093930 [fungal sp. No.11243]